MRYLLNNKLFENVAAAKSFLKKNDIPENDPKFVEIKNLLKDNPGYTLLFTKFCYNHDITIDQLTTLYNLLKQHKALLHNLPKQIDQYKKYEPLLDDLMDIESHVTFNKVVGELPGKFKKEAREDDEYFRLIIGMEEQVLNDYITFLKSKSSGYEDFEAIKNATIDHVNSYENKEKVLNKIKSCKGAVLEYNKNGILIVWIKDEDASKKLGSVSWCISTRGMWSNYNRPDLLRKQYFVWNYNVSHSDNDFRLGTTIEPTGGVHTSHLKDDSYVRLEDYCKKHKLSIEKNFKPLDKKSMVEYLREVKMTSKIFNKCVEYDVWREMSDLIPFNWRMMRGLVLPEDYEKMSYIQKIVVDYNSDKSATSSEAYNKAKEILYKEEQPFEHHFERYLFLNAFSEQFSSDLESDKFDELIGKILNPLLMNEDSDENYKYEFEYARGGNPAQIKIEMGEDDYLKTLDFGYDDYYAKMVMHVGYYGNTNDFFSNSDERDYFYGYLSYKNSDELKELLGQIGVDLSVIEDEKWYDELSKLGLNGPVDNFIWDLESRAEGELDSELRRAKDAIIFEFEEYRSRSKGDMVMGFDNILSYLSENPDLDGTIYSIIDDKPNQKCAEIFNTDELYMSAYLQNVDLAEECDKLISDIREKIENDEEMADKVIEYKEYINLINKYGFEKYGRSQYYKDYNGMRIVINKFQLDEDREGIVSGTITQDETHKSKHFKVKLDDLSAYIYNLKLDFFFENKRS